MRHEVRDLLQLAMPAVDNTHCWLSTCTQGKPKPPFATHFVACASSACSASLLLATASCHLPVRR
jgi:hypothetical protein